MDDLPTNSNLETQPPLKMRWEVWEVNFILTEAE